MTHDELVKFAAEKVGGEVCNPTGDELCVKTLFATLDPTMCSGWHIHDLTSPDLFFKGLAVLVKLRIDFVVEPKGVGIEYREFTGDYSSFDIHSSYKDVHSIEDIPQKFWECWAEAEGKGNLTKEGA